ncbi:unnamed protein product [Darwinula stevensoni]|uniref:receptor protein serine/threonine kinase n=1 Tax=Darwinula stevensoni TaxID=69355 RepID=A0A7R8ZYL1_9CRUS|nr:unnamed protein product [Darwinula stevensoni]CAG0881720.1 unnamed protein product [Darwinula stevensoni]
MYARGQLCVSEGHGEMKAGKEIKFINAHDNTDDSQDEEEDKEYSEYSSLGAMDILSHSFVDALPRYICHSCSHPCNGVTECTGALQCYTARVVNQDREEQLSKGCARRAEDISFYCKTKSFHHQELSSQYAMECCTGDLCNNGSFPILPPRVSYEELTSRSEESTTSYIKLLLLAILVPVSALIALVALTLWILRHFHEKRFANDLASNVDAEDLEALYGAELKATAAGESTLREFLDASLTSGSGSGLPLLVQRTLAKQITLKECIEMPFFLQGKPAIAHRDIKSKNILVKLDGTCCIADFGLAVTHQQKTGELNLCDNPRVGTRRYMAPEVLDLTMSTDCFDSFCKVDMYAVGLVLWEVARRCHDSNGICEDYKPPFYDMVPSDPSFEDMRKVVCVDQARPVISERWDSSEVLSAMKKIIEECWHHKPSVRPSSLRVKKSLQKLYQLSPTFLTSRPDSMPF